MTGGVIDTTAAVTAVRSNAVTVVGDVMTDIVVKPEGPLVRGSDRRAAIRMLPGGSGANQAAWLGHFGIHTRFAAKVGHADLAGCEEHMRGYGITPQLSTHETLPTGMLVTIVDPDGQRSFFTDRGANLTLDAADLPDDLLDGIGLAHISGYSLFGERPRAAVFDFLRRADQRAIGFTVDPGSVSFVEEVGPTNFIAWTSGAEICFPNDDEAAILAGTRDEQRQREFLSPHYGTLVIKRGERGAEVVGRNGKLLAKLPAPQVQVVDTTGAGDAFLAGYLSAYLASADIEQCLQRAITAGSAAVQFFGGQPEQRAPLLPIT
jgi:sugar/nucleoside kinase (ribokinase family)